MPLYRDDDSRAIGGDLGLAWTDTLYEFSPTSVQARLARDNAQHRNDVVCAGGDARPSRPDSVAYDHDQLPLCHDPNARTLRGPLPQGVDLSTQEDVVAHALFKSISETPWDVFSQAMSKALASAGADFARRHDRTLGLGSPVKLSEAGGDIIRLPIEVRGGRREYAIAYLHIKGVERKPDAARVRALAEEAVRIAEPYALTPPEKPGQVVLNYP